MLMGLCARLGLVVLLLLGTSYGCKITRPPLTITTNWTLLTTAGSTEPTEGTGTTTEFTVETRGSPSYPYLKILTSQVVSSLRPTTAPFPTLSHSPILPAIVSTHPTYSTTFPPSVPSTTDFYSTYTFFSSSSTTKFFASSSTTTTLLSSSSTTTTLSSSSPTTTISSSSTTTTLSSSSSTTPTLFASALTTTTTTTPTVSPSSLPPTPSVTSTDSTTTPIISVPTFSDTSNFNIGNLFILNTTSKGFVSSTPDSVGDNTTMENVPNILQAKKLDVAMELMSNLSSLRFNSTSDESTITNQPLRRGVELNSTSSSSSNSTGPKLPSSELLPSSVDNQTAERNASMPNISQPLISSSNETDISTIIDKSLSNLLKQHRILVTDDSTTTQTTADRTKKLE